LGCAFVARASSDVAKRTIPLNRGPLPHRPPARSFLFEPREESRGQTLISARRVVLDGVAFRHFGHDKDEESAAPPFRGIELAAASGYPMSMLTRRVAIWIAAGADGCPVDSGF
jgi:hypothetical protein